MPDPTDSGQLPLPVDPAALQVALTQMPQPAGVPPAMAPPNVGPSQQVQQQPDINLGGAQSQSPPPKQQTPPKQSAVPALAGFLQQMFQGPGYEQSTGGGPGDIGAQPGRPISRLDAFTNFVGNFLNSFATGMSNAGTGPAANARGFGAAVGAPYQRELQQYGLQQQQQQVQAQIAQQQAETQRTQAQAQMTPVQGIGGQTYYLPAEYAKSIIQAQIGGQARVEAAGVQKQYMVSPFGILDTKTGKLIGGTGAGGIQAMATVTPEMAKQYNIPPEYIGKQVKNSDLVGFMNAKSRDTTVAQGSEGPALVDKGTGATTPLGLGSPAANPLARAKFSLAQQAFDRDTFGTVFGKAIPSSLVDAQGNTLGWKSPSAPTASIKQQAQQAEDLGQLFKQVRVELAKANASGKLGPGAGRINDFMTGAVGADDPEFAKIRALGSLTASGMLKAHFGARGGQDMYNHFEGLFNTGKMTLGDLNGALDGFQTFMDQYAARVKTAGSQNGANAPSKVDSLAKKYGGG